MSYIYGYSVEGVQGWTDILVYVSTEIKVYCNTSMKLIAHYSNDDELESFNLKVLRNARIELTLHEEISGPTVFVVGDDSSKITYLHDKFHMKVGRKTLFSSKNFQRVKIGFVDETDTCYVWGYLLDRFPVIEGLKIDAKLALENGTDMSDYNDELEQLYDAVGKSELFDFSDIGWYAV